MVVFTSQLESVSIGTNEWNLNTADINPSSKEKGGEAIPYIHAHLYVLSCYPSWMKKEHSNHRTDSIDTLNWHHWYCPMHASDRDYYIQTKERINLNDNWAAMRVLLMNYIFGNGTRWILNDCHRHFNQGIYMIMGAYIEMSATTALFNNSNNEKRLGTSTRLSVLVWLFWSNHHQLLHPPLEWLGFIPLEQMYPIT